MTDAVDTHLPQEEDRVRTRTALWWIVAGIAMVLLGIGAPWAMMAVRGAPPPVHEGKGYGTAAPEFAGGLRTGMFERNTAGAADRQQSTSDLTRFEWIDPKAKLVRIPVSDAMQLWLARHHASGESDQEAAR